MNVIECHLHSLECIQGAGDVVKYITIFVTILRVNKIPVKVTSHLLAELLVNVRVELVRNVNEG